MKTAKEKRAGMASRGRMCFGNSAEHHHHMMMAGRQLVAVPVAVASKIAKAESIGLYNHPLILSSLPSSPDSRAMLSL